MFYITSHGLFYNWKFVPHLILFTYFPQPLTLHLSGNQQVCFLHLWVSPFCCVCSFVLFFIWYLSLSDFFHLAQYPLASPMLLPMRRFYFFYGWVNTTLWVSQFCSSFSRLFWLFGSLQISYEFRMDFLFLQNMALGLWRDYIDSVDQLSIIISTTHECDFVSCKFAELISSNNFLIDS